MPKSSWAGAGGFVYDCASVLQAGIAATCLTGVRRYAAFLHPNLKSFKVNPVMIAQAKTLANLPFTSRRTDSDMIAQARFPANSLF